MKWLFALLLGSGGLFWLLHDPAPSEADVVGVYTGTYQGYVDQVELTNDHKFNQVLRTPRGETMERSGTWKLTNKALELNGYLFFIDQQVDGSTDKPIRTSLMFAAYRGMLIRDWDTGFFKLTKQ